MITTLLTAEALRRHQDLYAHAEDSIDTADEFLAVQATEPYWQQLLSVRSGDRIALDVSDQTDPSIEYLLRGFEALGYHVIRESVTGYERSAYLIVSWGVLPSSVAPAAADAPTRKPSTQLNLNAIDVTSVTQFRDSLLETCRNTRHLFDRDIPALHFQSAPGDELVQILRELAAGHAPALTVDTTGLHINGPEDAAVLMILPDLVRNEGCTVAVEGTRLHITYPVRACR